MKTAFTDNLKENEKKKLINWNFQTSKGKNDKKNSFNFKILFL